MVNDTKYFKSSEMIYSETAEKYNIDNTPTDEEVIDNINYTLQRLNEIREGYGKPIYINSGYRCHELNCIIGGVQDSKHKTGLAVDLRWDIALLEYIIDNCSFDKLIREKNTDSKWIHIQFKRDKNEERRLTYSISK